MPSAVITRLVAAHTASDSVHDQPSASCNTAVTAAISRIQAEAPNAIATPVKARARPRALRASDRSALTSTRNALAASLAAFSPARPASPTWRSDSARSGAGGLRASGFGVVSSLCGSSIACPLADMALLALESSPGERRLRRDVPDNVHAAGARTRPGYIRGLLVAAAGELGDDPARGDAERGQRSLADQVRRAVDQVAALVHQRVHLLARHAAGVFGGGEPGQRSVGQVGLDVGLAEAQLVGRRARGAAQRFTRVRGGLLEVTAGFAEMGLHAIGIGGGHALSPGVAKRTGAALQHLDIAAPAATDDTEHQPCG